MPAPVKASAPKGKGKAAATAATAAAAPDCGISDADMTKRIVEWDSNGARDYPELVAAVVRLDFVSVRPLLIVSVPPASL